MHTNEIAGPPPEWETETEADYPQIPRAEITPTPAPPPLPATFSDGAGREWQLELTFARIARINTRVGIDFGNLQEIGRAWAWTLFDDLKAIEAVWIALGGSDDENDAEAWARYDDEETVTKLGLLESLDAVQLDAGRQALKNAIENFTPPLKRTILREGLGAVNQTYRKLIAEIEEKVKTATQPAIEQAVKLFRSGKPVPNGRGFSGSSTTTGRRDKRSRR